MEDSGGRRASQWGVRLLGLLAAMLGVSYIVWRYGWSLNPQALWFAIPLVAAETYSVVDSLLLVVMMWKPLRRTPPPPLEDASVDVFITTYNEPVELVARTASAARRIDWPALTVYVLDDGAREEMREAAGKLGCGYIRRGEEWTGKPRHAKAGNVNNALMQTAGDFILILDADQIPAPAIVRRSIGYFRDQSVAFVQTPQQFYNLPPGDPFGSDAPLFYGPIMRGKDGWNAAFFCGSNAVLRREALMRLGVAEYAKETQRRFSQGLRVLERSLSRAAVRDRRRRGGLRLLERAVAEARRSLRGGAAVASVEEKVRSAADFAVRTVAEDDLAALATALGDLAASGDAAAAEAGRFLLRNSPDLARRLTAAPDSLGLREDAFDSLDLTRSEEAMPVLPLATISITEDMATAMRLHAMGWKSVYHDEVLAYGLAPEDLGSALGQRLRWAQGTMQVMVRENPLFKPGLTMGQRIQYLTTMYSYFSGFASLIYLVWPVIFLVTGIAPVKAWSVEFFARLLPYLVLNKLAFRVATRGVAVQRGEQYSLGLFPIWIRSVVSVLTGTKLRFVVTPKQRQAGTYFRLVWVQLLMLAATMLAAVYGAVTFFLGRGPSLVGLLVNVFWGGYNIRALWAVVSAAFYSPPPGWSPRPPELLDDSDGERSDSRSP